MGYLRIPDLLMMLAYAGLMLFVGWWYSRSATPPKNTSSRRAARGRGSSASR